jgi:hypothetical protein
VLPPSQGLAKRYKWKRTLREHEIPLLPEKLKSDLLQVTSSHSDSLQVTVTHSNHEKGKAEGGSPEPSISLKRDYDYIRNTYNYILNTLNYKYNNLNSKSEGVTEESLEPEYFIEGQRESDLFSLANALIKQGKDLTFVREVLTRVMFTCHDVDPVFIEEKLRNAVKRHGNPDDTPISDQVSQYLRVTQGTFSVTDLYRDLGIVTPSDRANCRKKLGREVKNGIIEHSGNKNGYYRLVQQDLKEVDWKNAKVGNYYDLKMPMGLHEKLGLHPKGIMVIAGSPNTGKTAFTMTMALMNKGAKVSYFNSEMGEEEVAERIAHFEHAKSDWDHIKFYDRNRNFADVIRPNGLNIIDFLEMTDNFYLIGEEIRKIHDKLDKGVCVLCLQKKKGQELGRGAEFSLEKPRIYLSMDYQMIKVVKSKSSRNGYNMNGVEIPFKLINGATFIQTEDNLSA